MPPCGPSGRSNHPEKCPKREVAARSNESHSPHAGCKTVNLWCSAPAHNLMIPVDAGGPAEEGRTRRCPGDTHPTDAVEIGDWGGFVARHDASPSR